MDLDQTDIAYVIATYTYFCEFKRHPHGARSAELVVMRETHTMGMPEPSAADTSIIVAVSAFGGAVVKGLFDWAIRSSSRKVQMEQAVNERIKLAFREHEREVRALREELSRFKNDMSNTRQALQIDESARRIC